MDCGIDDMLDRGVDDMLDRREGDMLDPDVDDMRRSLGLPLEGRGIPTTGFFLVEKQNIQIKNPEMATDPTSIRMRTQIYGSNDSCAQKLDIYFN